VQRPIRDVRSGKTMPNKSYRLIYHTTSRLHSLEVLGLLESQPKVPTVHQCVPVHVIGDSPYG
jgi:hypothetical protein